MVNFFADHLLIKLWGILFSSIPNGNMEKSSFECKKNFFFMLTVTLLIYEYQSLNQNDKSLLVGRLVTFKSDKFVG